jgi:hypothetical protein
MLVTLDFEKRWLSEVSYWGGHRSIFKYYVNDVDTDAGNEAQGENRQTKQTSKKLFWYEPQYV